MDKKSAWNPGKDQRLCSPRILGSVCQDLQGKGGTAASALMQHSIPMKSQSRSWHTRDNTFGMGWRNSSCWKGKTTGILGTDQNKFGVSCSWGIFTCSRRFWGILGSVPHFSCVCTLRGSIWNGVPWPRPRPSTAHFPLEMQFSRKKSKLFPSRCSSSLSFQQFPFRS